MTVFCVGVPGVRRLCLCVCVCVCVCVDGWMDGWVRGWVGVYVCVYVCVVVSAQSLTGTGDASPRAWRGVTVSNGL